MLGDTLSADRARELCLGIVARTQKWDESQGNPKVVRTPSRQGAGVKRREVAVDLRDAEELKSARRTLN